MTIVLIWGYLKLGEKYKADVIHITTKYHFKLYSIIAVPILL